MHYWKKHDKFVFFFGMIETIVTFLLNADGKTFSIGGAIFDVSLEFSNHSNFLQ